MARAAVKAVEYYSDPPIARVLFSSTRLAWLWAAMRIWLGYQWIGAARHKIGGRALFGAGRREKGPRPARGPPPGRTSLTP